MKTEKYTFKGDTKIAMNKIEEMIKTCFGHSNIKIISEKFDNNGRLYYPARRLNGIDDLADDIKIFIRKVNNSTTSIKLEDSEFLPNDNWRRPVLNDCYSICKHVLMQICEKYNRDK